MNITLIGMPGAGKSTVGKRLAEGLGYTFVDIDEELGKSHGKPYQELLKEVGDKRFLALEAREALKLKGINDTVICTAGSSVYSPKAMAHLKRISVVIFLDLSIGEIQKRVTLDSRGIVGLGKKSVEELYEERTKLYRKYMDKTIEVENVAVERVVSQIMRYIGNLN